MSARIQGLLPAKPIRGKGVRRLNRWPIYICGAALMAIFLVIGYTYEQKAAAQREVTSKADSSSAEGSGDHAKDLLGPAPRATPPDRTPHGLRQQQAYTPPPQAPSIDAAEQARIAAWQSYYQKLAAEQQAKFDASGKALIENTSVDLGGGQSGGAPTQSMAGMPGALPGQGEGFPSAGVDSGAQAEKRAFLSQGGDVLGLNETLAGSVHGQKPDTIMEGTAIPGVLVGGMTSDMPGMVKGQVNQNVCDTETGNDLLIPQGTTVVGTYDNSVSNGQERIGVIWTRLIFPDTSSRQIGSMEGADQGGYAGFHDQVNTHFWSKFGQALIVSLIGAGAQLAQPPPPANGFYSPWSTGAGGITSQMSQFGQAQAQGASQRPNTLEIRPGYLFNIMAQKDIPLPVYHGMSCDGSGQMVARPINLGPVLQ